MASARVRILLTIVVLLLLPVVLAAALLGFVHTPAGEGWLGRRIAGLSGGRVEGVVVAWPLQLRVDRLTAADADGEWLEVRGAVLDWTPGALLGGTFAARRLAAEHIGIARSPTDEGSGGDGGGLPRLPLDIAIEELSADISYGNELSMALRASAHLSEAAVHVDADVRRTDVPGAGTAIIAFDRDAGRLKIDVTADQRLGAALALYGLPPLALRVSGEGPLSNWHGGLVATHDGDACAEADLHLSGQPDRDIAANGHVEPECMPAEARAALAGAPVIFDTAASWGTGGVDIARLELTAGTLTATASGSVGDTYSLRFALDADELARLPATGATGAVHLTGSVVGTRTAPVIDIAVTSPHGSVNGRGWRDLQARLLLRAEADDWVVSASSALTATGLVPAIDGPLTLAVDARLNQRSGLARIPALRLDTRLGTLTLRGTARQFGQALALTGLLRTASLDELAPAASGRAMLAVAVHGDALRPDLRVSVAGSTYGLRTGVAPLDGLLGPVATITGGMAITAAGIPALDASLTGAAATLRLGGAVSPVLGLGWHLAIADLAALPGAELTGAVEARGYAVGRIDRPHVGLVARSDGITHAGAGTYAFVAAAGLDDIEPAPTGLFKAGIAGRGKQADVSAAFHLGDGVAFEDIVIASGADRITGAVSIAGDAGLSGTLHARIADLDTWEDVAGTDLDGRLQASVEVSGTAFEARLNGNDLVIAGTALRQASLDLAGNPRAVDFRLDTQGELGIQARGSWQADQGRSTVRLAALQLHRAGHTARLVEPTTVSQTPDGWRLALTTFDLASGRVSLAGATAGDRLDLRADVRRLPLELVDVVLPEQGMTGLVDGELRLQGTVAAPQAEARLQGRGIGFAGGRERIDADVTASWHDRVVRVGAVASGMRGASAQLDATFPLVLDGGLHVPGDGPLAGRLQADGQIERIAEALPLPGHRFAGRINADLLLGGTVADPRVDGAATVADGYYEFYRTGTILRDVQARLTAEDARRFRLNLQGADPGGGRVGADGVLRLEEAGMAYTAGVRLMQFRIVDIDSGAALASGDLTLQGEGSLAALTGTVDVGPAEFNITGHLPGGSVPHIEVVEINRPGARKQPSRRGGDERGQDVGVETPLVISLGIDTRVNRLFVRGRGLDSVWSGRLTIEGTAADPTIVGALEAERGSYDLIGRNFQLAGSRVVFEGSASPRLDIIAESAAPDITARVRVTGSPDQPVIDFTSEPAYPKDEILARLLFGKQVGQLTVGQQVQLARAAAAFSGRGALDPIGGLRQALGLDVLEVGTAEDEDGTGGISPRVTFGKYLDDDTFLKVEEGGTKDNQVSIERQLGRGLTVEGGVGRAGGGSIGLNWRRDY